jgi:integrase/recombinase XerD
MMLFESIRTYVDRKRSFALLYETAARNLKSFANQVGDIPLGSVTPREISSFLDAPGTSSTTWRAKFNLLKHFFEYWAARGMLRSLPMPAIRPPSAGTFVPHIYSRTGVRCLLQGTRLSQRQDACRMDSATLRMFLLFLYATGALVGEALRLSHEDVDLKNDCVTIRGTRFNRVRRIPIGPDLHDRLRRYVDSLPDNRGNRFFANKDGSAINAITLGKSFKRLRMVSGIGRQDGSYYQPRMLDLRHTFAVHRVTAWFKQGANLNRLLPALSAYLGQVDLCSAERYLSMTPERFRNQLVKLSPQRRTRRWRDDPALMKFLSNL